LGILPLRISGFLRNFLDFWGVLRIFGNINGILRFFLILWEKVDEFDHPGNTGKIGIFENF
jgi:hypothetical protein